MLWMRTAARLVVIWSPAKNREKWGKGRCALKATMRMDKLKIMVGGEGDIKCGIE